MKMSRGNYILERVCAKVEKIMGRCLVRGLLEYYPIVSKIEKVLQISLRSNESYKVGRTQMYNTEHHLCID